MSEHIHLNPLHPHTTNPNLTPAVLYATRLHFTAADCSSQPQNIAAIT